MEVPVLQRMEEMINVFIRALQIHRYYGKEHQLTQEAVENLSKLLDGMLEERPVVTIGIIGNELAFGKEPLYELSIKKKSFIKYMKQIGMQRIQFVQGLNHVELIQFIDQLPAGANEVTSKQDWRDFLKEAGIHHIRISDIGIQSEEIEEDTEKKDSNREVMKTEYLRQVQYLSKTFNDLKTTKNLNVHSARQIVTGLMKNLFKNQNLLLMLTSMKMSNENSFEHGVNVAIFTLLQAEILGLEQKYLVDIGMSAMLHDVGKIADPDSGGALFNSASWERDELDTLSDPKDAAQDIRGAKLLLETEGISTLSAIVAFEHNMNYDLSGSYTKLYGRDLNLISMMICISDHYDKLRKQAFYYEDGGPEKAYEDMMKLSGKRFHPDLLNNFFSVIGVYPPGTLVELDSEEVALVIQTSVFDIRRPQVEILYDGEGERYQSPKIVNLVEKDHRGKFKRSIVKSISPKSEFNAMQTTMES